MHTERTIVIDINLTRGLGWILFAIAILSSVLLYLALGGEPARASVQIQSTALRQYYLTTSPGVRGNSPLTACASGYHFALLWEIVDPSNLQYNNSLGLTSPDSGHGLPVAIPFFSAALPVRGWVRTGRLAGTSSTPGQGNCNAWTSASGFYRGTIVNLPSNWTAGDQDVGVWNAYTSVCDSPRRVWCVPDGGPLRAFLRLTLK